MPQSSSGRGVSECRRHAFQICDPRAVAVCARGTQQKKTLSSETQSQFCPLPSLQYSTSRVPSVPIVGPHSCSSSTSSAASTSSVSSLFDFHVHVISENTDWAARLQLLGLKALDESTPMSDVHAFIVLVDFSHVADADFGTLSDYTRRVYVSGGWVLERLLSGSRPISGTFRVRSLSRPFATCACVVIPRKLRRHWWVHSRVFGECGGLVTSITFDLFMLADRASLPILYSSSAWLLLSFMRFSPSPTVRETQSSFQSQLLGTFLAMLWPNETAYQLVQWRHSSCARTGSRATAS